MPLLSPFTSLLPTNGGAWTEIPYFGGRALSADQITAVEGGDKDGVEVKKLWEFLVGWKGSSCLTSWRSRLWAFWWPPRAWELANSRPQNWHSNLLLWFEHGAPKLAPSLLAVTEKPNSFIIHLKYFHFHLVDHAFIDTYSWTCLAPHVLFFNFIIIN